MNLTDRKFCEDVLLAEKSVEGIEGSGLEDALIGTMARLARIALAEADAKPQRRFIHCRDCEAWRFQNGRVEESRYCTLTCDNKDRIGLIRQDDDGCCQGFPKVTEG